MDVRCQSVWTYSNIHSMVLGKQMPTCRDLQLYPHIQTSKATCDHRKENANLQGLITVSSHTNQTEDKMSGQDDGLTTRFHIIGANAKAMDLQLSSMGKQQ